MNILIDLMLVYGCPTTKHIIPSSNKHNEPFDHIKMAT